MKQEQRSDAHDLTILPTERGQTPKRAIAALHDLPDEAERGKGGRQNGDALSFSTPFLANNFDLGLLLYLTSTRLLTACCRTMKLDATDLRYLSPDEFRILTAVRHRFFSLYCVRSRKLTLIPVHLPSLASTSSHSASYLDTDSFCSHARFGLLLGMGGTRPKWAPRTTRSSLPLSSLKSLASVRGVATSSWVSWRRGI